jgi:hypothetical protein
MPVFEGLVRYFARWQDIIGVEAWLTCLPYGDSLFSSFRRSLWKSYLLSCRTKLEKLLCLKCFGRISLVNLSVCVSSCQQPEERAEEQSLGRGEDGWCVPRVSQRCHLRCPISLYWSMQGPQASWQRVSMCCRRWCRWFVWAKGMRRTYKACEPGSEGRSVQEVMEGMEEGR